MPVASIFAMHTQTHSLFEKSDVGTAKINAATTQLWFAKQIPDHKTFVKTASAVLNNGVKRNGKDEHHLLISKRYPTVQNHRFTLHIKTLFFILLN